MNMRKLIIFLLFSNFLISNAQNNIFNESNQLKYRDEESYKSINFKVEWFDSDKSEASLKQLLKSNSDVFYTVYNSLTKECTVESKLNIDRTYINSLLGTKGYKISEYTEKVHLFVSTRQVSASEQKRLTNVRKNSDKYYREDLKINSSKSVSGEQIGSKISNTPVKSRYDAMTTTEKIKYFENLKSEALKKGYPTQKYDLRISELKNTENK
ncbi:MAG: hypothetical protein A2033_16335 [Bacteroidetes bacterium GWA2_31_9]|nr:MAG: hypothetical protein A2033_16335 [Bacteroidetes bacterium GWA2_31_9]